MAARGVTMSRGRGWVSSIWGQGREAGAGSHRMHAPVHV
jgi:hypothetical protein